MRLRNFYRIYVKSEEREHSFEDCKSFFFFLFNLEKIYFRPREKKTFSTNVLPLLLGPWLARTLAGIVRFLGISARRSVRASTFTTLASTITSGLIAGANINYFVSEGYLNNSNKKKQVFETSAILLKALKCRHRIPSKNLQLKINIESLKSSSWNSSKSWFWIILWHCISVQ